MSEKYRIKEKYKHLVDHNIMNRDFTRDRHGRYICEQKTVSQFSGEMFDKVEKRISVNVGITNSVIRKSDLSDFTQEEIQLCEKAVNYELKSDDQIIEKVNEWIRKLQRYSVSVDLIASHRVDRKVREDGEFVTYEDLSSFEQYLQDHPLKPVEDK